MYSVLPGSGYN